jgi:CDP-glucose 4,6-dehydratase
MLVKVEKQKPKNNFWKGRRTLVTGYEGFLGSHLTKKLLSMRARVVGIDKLTFRKNTLLNSHDLKKMTIIRGNVANYRLLQQTLHQHRIEIVFHLAAEAIVGQCLKSPRRTFSSNIRGTWTVLDACRNTPSIQAVVVASSDKAYGSHNKLPYDENSALAGAHPYDVSKSCADLLAHTYFHTYGLPVCITRCGNIYGPGDFHLSRIVPDTILSAIKNKTLLIRSDGKFTRDYVYVDDIVDGYLLLAEKIQELNLSGEAFNFSGENPITVIELVNKIFKIVHKKPNYRILNQSKYEIKEQYLSARKARKTLYWKPRYDLEEGLKKAIEWYSLGLIS